MRIGSWLKLGAFRIMVVAIACSTGACGATASASPGSTAPASPGATVAPSTATWGDASAIKVATDAAKGPYLTDAAGRALYIYDRDSTMSACYGDCARTWPPVLANATTPVAAPGVTKPVRTSERTDGTFQVAYAGAWLYYSAADLVAGDVKGDGQGGVWHLAKP